MRPSTAVQNPPWLRAPSSSGKGASWGGGRGGCALFTHSALEDRGEETGLPQLPSQLTGTAIPSHQTEAALSVNHHSEKWSFLSPQSSGRFSAGLHQEAEPLSRVLSTGGLLPFLEALPMSFSLTRKTFPISAIGVPSLNLFSLYKILNKGTGELESIML